MGDWANPDGNLTDDTTAMSDTPEPMTELRKGVLLATSAFAVWGVVPIYFKQLHHVPPVEVVAHRVMWTVALTGALMLATTGGRGFVDLLKNRKRLAGLAASATCIAFNWIFFIIGVNTDRVLETSLGYFINPLVSVFLGLVVLGERLRPRQYLAVGIAAMGVLISLAVYGKLPALSLILAFSFGMYGLLRKSLAVDAFTGLFTETLILSPVAIAYVVYVSGHGGNHFISGDMTTKALLAGASVVTATPLVLFAMGARRIPLTTVGILQYIAPSLSFLEAIFLYHEAFTVDRIVTFGFIWVALAIYTVDTLHANHRAVVAARAAAKAA